MRLPSTRIRRIRQRIRRKINPLTRVEKKSIRNESDKVWAGESGYFRVRGRKKRLQSLVPFVIFLAEDKVYFHYYIVAFSCPGPTLLLVGTTNRYLWPNPALWACAEFSFLIFGQSDLSGLIERPWIADFRCWGVGSAQKLRFLMLTRKSSDAGDESDIVGTLQSVTSLYAPWKPLNRWLAIT